MNIKTTCVVLALFVAGCGGTTNLLKQYEKKPGNFDKAAKLLEDGNPIGARSVLLNQMPEASQLILLDDNRALDDYSFSKELAQSLGGVAGADKILSMYATTEAAVQDVSALNIMVDIMEIDDNLKSSGASLNLDQASDDAAISKFYPAMPSKCATLSAVVMRGLDKAIAILYATAILRGFDETDLAAHKVELLQSLTEADMFNNAIFCQVNFICRVMNLDADGDKAVSSAEAAAIGSLSEATKIYDRIPAAIDAVKAMVVANPKDKNLPKALKRMEDYKAKIDNDAGSTLLEKLMNFLVSQSRG